MSETPAGLQVKLRPMTMADLPQVEILDRESFPAPWPKDAFRYELTRNPNSVCWVAEWKEPEEEPVLVGSIVIWLVVGEAHISTLAVKQGYRQRGIAQRLLARTLLICHQRGASRALLEVRESNKAAQALYRKFGFEGVGLRCGYYRDTHEDAILMTLEPLEPEKLADLADHG